MPQPSGLDVDSFLAATDARGIARALRAGVPFDIASERLALPRKYFQSFFRESPRLEEPILRIRYTCLVCKNPAQVWPHQHDQRHKAGAPSTRRSIQRQFQNGGVEAWTFRMDIKENWPSLMHLRLVQPRMLPRLTRDKNP